MPFFQVLFLWTFSRLWKYIIRNSHYTLAHRKGKRISEKHLLLLYWLHQTFDCVDHHKLCKIFQEMGIPDHITCLLRNLYVCQEATVRTRHGTTDWFQIEKGAHQGCILSPCLFNLYAVYILQNARLDEAEAEIKIARRDTITSDMQITQPLWQKVKRN